MKSKGRGFLCESIQDKAIQFLGFEISQKELRLYPFLDYSVKNGGYLDRSKMDGEEMKIIKRLQEQGHVKRTFDGYFYTTKAFYDFMQSVLADSYVVFMEDE